MKFLVFVTEPSIYHGCSTRKTFWEEKSTGKQDLFQSVNMTNCGRCKVSKHKDIKGSDKCVTLNISKKFDSPNKMETTSSIHTQIALGWWRTKSVIYFKISCTVSYLAFHWTICREDLPVLYLILLVYLLLKKKFSTATYAYKISTANEVTVLFLTLRLFHHEDCINFILPWF